MSHSSPVASLKAEYEQAALLLAERLAALPETDMRTAALAEAFANMGAIQGAWTLETLIRGAMAKQSECLVVYGSLLDADPLMRLVGNERLDAMVQAARPEGCIAAMHWLLSASGGDGEMRSANADQLVDSQLRDLPLGVRRALARRAAGDTMARLACDPDAGVITNLLNNPRVTEQTVLAICSRRPTVSAALEAVLRSPRWSRSYRVRVALVKNPYLSQKFALNLLVTLARHDLSAVRDDDTLTGGLRLAAQRLIDLSLVAAPTAQRPRSSDPGSDGGR